MSGDEGCPAFLQAKLAFVSIREYAAHSYIYYDKDQNIISDGDYDLMCKWLLENFTWLKPHDINNYLREDMLKCGSGYDITVTGLTRDYAELLLAHHNESKQVEHDPFE
jgi:hypothetical protein